MERTISSVHQLINKIIQSTVENFPGIQPTFAFVGYRDVSDGANQFKCIPFTAPEHIARFAARLESSEFAASGG